MPPVLTGRARPVLVGYAALAAVFLVFVACALRYRAVPMVDDAPIFFRYVDLMLAGQGIVYNPGGEPVYGASCLPYTFALAVLAAAGIPLEAAALAINLLSLAAAVALLYSLCIRGGLLPRPLALIPCAFALFQSTTLVWVTQGLESGFHLLLCVACIWCYDRRKDVLCGLWLAAAMMDKLDAVSLAAALVVAHLWRERRLPIRIGLVALAAYLPWLAFTTWYFGSVIPMSLQAKQLEEFATAGHRVLLHYRNLPLGLALALGQLFLVRRPFSRVLSLWLVAYVVLYDVVTRGKPFPWYYFPSDFILFFLAGLTVARLCVFVPLSGRFAGALRHVPKVATVVAAAAGLVLAGQSLSDARAHLLGMRAWSATIEADRVDIGHWLRRYAAPGESVYTGHGWIQYLAGLHVYDPSGLNDPEFVRLKRAGREGEYLLQRRPHYLVNHDYVPPEALRDQYVLLARFTRTKAGTGWPDWNLWGRRDSAALRKLDARELPLTFPRPAGGGT